MERNTPKRHSGNHVYPLAAGAIIHAGHLVVLEGGYAVPAKAAIDLIAVGRANASVNNSSGFAGAASIEVEAGEFRWDNKADDPVTQAEVGKPCFVIDSCTVARTDAEGTRSRAGIVRGLDDGGVWVETI
jgi:hypothetical protein